MAELRLGRRTLSETLIATARRRPFQMAMVDPSRGPLTWIKAAAGAVVLARALRGCWRDEERVGILLPSSVGGALVNAAAAMSGRVTVNLNYTIGAAGMEAAARKAGLATVVTSKLFLTKGSIEPPSGVELIMLEDVARTVRPSDRILGLLLAALAPRALLCWLIGAVRRPVLSDPCTIIFSSGSTGEPKGVPLTHLNIVANIDSAFGALDVSHRDRITHVLPFFHAYGHFLYWASVRVGAPLIFLPNPLDAAAVADLVEKYQATLICATPTFFQMYRKRIDRSRFSSLKIVIAGAEKLSPKVHDELDEYFDGHVIEGYGCTECSPVISVNLPKPGGTKRGTVGRPLPGVDVRVVHPESFGDLAPGSPGMLLVRGANVMEGYLDADDVTAEVMRENWYVTGDIASVDDDGFITISDRLARFAKIGGEMVPHRKVEEALHEAAGADVGTFAVTSVPDERRGEALAVVHVLEDVAVRGLCDCLRDRGLPNLFIPKTSHFIRVDELPMLGTGKLDLRAIRALAAQRLLPVTQRM